MGVFCDFVWVSFFILGAGFCLILPFNEVFVFIYRIFYFYIVTFIIFWLMFNCVHIECFCCVAEMCFKRPKTKISSRVEIQKENRHHFQINKAY